jgi:hypothetical protein
MLITSLDHPLRRGDIVNLDKVVVSTARTQAEKVAMFADGKSFDHSLAIVLATTRDTFDLRPLRWVGAGVVFIAGVPVAENACFVKRS